MARMGEGRGAYRVLVGRLEGKRLFLPSSNPQAREPPLFSPPRQLPFTSGGHLLNPQQFPPWVTRIRRVVSAVYFKLYFSFHSFKFTILTLPQDYWELHCL